MPDFHSIDERPGLIDFQPRSRFQFAVMLSAEEGSLPGIAWQLIKELTETIFIPAKIWRQLPQDRSEFVAEREKTGGKKIGERYFCATELFHVSNKTRSFDAKDEVRRRFRSPPEIARRKLKRIK